MSDRVEKVKLALVLNGSRERRMINVGQSQVVTMSIQATN